MSYLLRVYCSACNSPSNTRYTVSGNYATSNYTASTSKNIYQKNKNRRILLEIDNGEQIILCIQDYHGSSDEILEIYIGESKVCRCSFHPLNGRTCDFRYI